MSLQSDHAATALRAFAAAMERNPFLRSCEVSIFQESLSLWATSGRCVYSDEITWTDLDAIEAVELLIHSKVEQVVASVSAQVNEEDRDAV